MGSGFAGEFLFSVLFVVIREIGGSKNPFSLLHGTGGFLFTIKRFALISMFLKNRIQAKRLSTGKNPQTRCG